MRKITMGILSFIKNAHSTGTSESAKRLYGGVGFLMASIWIVYNGTFVDVLLYVSASLLGLESVTGILTKKTTE